MTELGIRAVPKMVHVSQQCGHDQAPCRLWHPLTATASPMSASQPLLTTIEADDPTEVLSGPLSASQPKTARPAVVLTPTTTNASNQMANTVGDAESGECYSYQRSYL